VYQYIHAVHLNSLVTAAKLAFRICFSVANVRFFLDYTDSIL